MNPRQKRFAVMTTSTKTKNPIRRLWDWLFPRPTSVQGWTWP